MDTDDEYHYSDGEYEYEDEGDYNNQESDVEGEDSSSQPMCGSLTVHEECKSSSCLQRQRSGSLKRDRDTSFSVPDGGYEIHDYKTVSKILDSLVEEVASLLDLDADGTQVLLQNNRWDKERLMDAFFASPEKLLQEAGLDLYSSEIVEALKEERLMKRLIPSDGRTTFECGICRDPEADLSDAFSLGCGHMFCRGCYGQYLDAQVSDGPSCVLAKCPQHKCTQLVTKSMIAALCSPEAANKYTVYVLRNFIEVSKTMRYCPAAGCEKVAVGSNITTVRCSCSNPFCFKCGEEAHEPTSCQQVSEWNLKCMNESETANWILANTKKCPACNARIEKNHGCNHMHCKLCKHEFCWICMGPWGEHGQNTGGYYKCNRYDPNRSDGNESAAQKAKAELDRYLHYYQRYHGHDSALKFAANQREQAEKRMIEKQESERSAWIDVQFLKQAAEQVIECRRVLKFTYVLGYHLEDNSPEKQLFEHHQEMLEKNTEELQQQTEKSMDQIDRTQVVNLTRVTEKFMQSLLCSMQGGIVDSSSLSTLNSQGSEMNISTSPDIKESYMAMKEPGTSA